ncbi:MAG: molybdopterin-dependent oxidoreductase [Pirellulaceae bacterium]
MTESPTLRITGEVTTPLTLTYEDLAAMPVEYQLEDISRLDPKRRGDAVKLRGLLQRVGVKSAACYLGLHSRTDDFHASIPLAPIADRAYLIYRLHGQPLTVQQGGPFRFYILDYAACHTHEIDECANVKFVDHMELTVSAGFDNRPHDGQEHEELHRRQATDK